MSGSALNDATLRMPTMFILAQWDKVLPNDAGGHRRFFSSSALLVASTYPAIAGPKHGKPTRTDCRVIASGDQIGTSGRILSPSAAQLTMTASSAMRSRSSSHWPRVGAFALVGVTDRSMRSMMPGRGRPP
jgi:hypothetical protein